MSAFLMAFAVPPDAIRVSPRAWSFLAKEIRPVLSETLRRAGINQAKKISAMKESGPKRVPSGHTNLIPWIAGASNLALGATKKIKRGPAL
jgi:hypothetical protein